MAGASLGEAAPYSVIIIGLVGGMVLAILVCGLVAVFISMRNELVAIRNLLVKQSQ